jgi:uncharacterized protein (DUF1330 family)
MNSRVSIALALVAAFGIGAATIEGLHAQSKPPVFTIAEIDVSNVDAYTKEYAPKAQALIRAKGGKILVGSNNIVALEGQPAKRLAVHQWDSLEKAKGWHSSPEYKEIRKVGDKYAKFRILAAEGLPQQ